MIALICKAAHRPNSPVERINRQQRKRVDGLFTGVPYISHRAAVLDRPCCKGFSLRLSFSILVAQEPSLVACAECDQLWKDYADASLQRVRAYGNLKLANLRSDSETIEMLAKALATATEQLEEVKRKIREHDSPRHTFQKPTRRRAEWW